MRSLRFLVRGHCQNRPMIYSFIFYVLFFCCLLFFFFSDVMGWCVSMLWGFSDCDPPLPTQHPFSPQKTPNPTTLPSPSSSSRRSWVRKLRFTFVAVHLGSLVGDRLHLGRGVLYLRLAFGIFILHSLSAFGGWGRTQVRGRTRKRRKRECPLTFITSSSHS